MNNEVVVRLELHLSPEQAVGLMAQLSEGLRAQEQIVLRGFQNPDEAFEAAMDFLDAMAFGMLYDQYNGRYI